MKTSNSNQQTLQKSPARIQRQLSPSVRYVNRDEFISLLISGRLISHIRWLDIEDTSGLLDRTTGEIVLIGNQCLLGEHSTN